MNRTCLLVADATRARIYTFEQDREPDGLRQQLREEVDLVDAARRERPSDLFSDNSGGNHVAHHGYAFDDHRSRHLDELDAAFAREIARTLHRVVATRGYRAVIVTASPRMLGRLRPHLATLRHSTLTLDELAQDLTQLTTAELRDRLVELLPARPRGTFASR